VRGGAFADTRGVVSNVEPPFGGGQFGSQCARPFLRVSHLYVRHALGVPASGEPPLGFTLDRLRLLRIASAPADRLGTHGAGLMSPLRRPALRAHGCLTARAGDRVQCVEQRPGDAALAAMRYN